MAKDGKSALKPRLRFPDFRKDDAWEEKSLKDICDINPPSDCLPDSFIYIDLESVEGGILNARNCINKKDAPSRAQRFLKNGDVVFQAVRPYQRNNLFVQFDDSETYVASTGYAQLRAHDSERFLYQIVHTDPFVDKVIAKCTGSSYPAINSSDLADVLVLFPPSPREQQKIADCLTSLDEVIAAQGRKVAALAAHKRGLMQRLFPREGETLPRLRFPEFHDEPEWETASIQELIDKKLIVGHLDGNHGELYPRADEFASEGIPYITANDFKDGFVKFGDCKRLPMERAIKFKKGVARDGDILFAHNATVGPVAKLSTEYDFVILSTTATYFRCDHNLLLNDFLLFVLASPSFVEQYTRVMSQTTRDQIPITAQRKFFLSIPKLPEQRHIAACLSALDAQIAAESEKFDALKSHKKGLTQQLFPSPEGD